MSYMERCYSPVIRNPAKGNFLIHLNLKLYFSFSKVQQGIHIASVASYNRIVHFKQPNANADNVYACGSTTTDPDNFTSNGGKVGLFLLISKII